MIRRTLAALSAALLLTLTAACSPLPSPEGPSNFGCTAGQRAVSVRITATDGPLDVPNHWNDRTIVDFHLPVDLLVTPIKVDDSPAIITDRYGEPISAILEALPIRTPTSYDICVPADVVQVDFHSVASLDLETLTCWIISDGVYVPGSERSATGTGDGNIFESVHDLSCTWLITN